MSNTFYSPREQFLREWRNLWQLYGIDTLIGGVYVVGGFYVFHRVGYSQVYNVIMPFLIASVVAAYLTYTIYNPQSSGKTLPYFFNLPRHNRTVWNAHCAFIVCVILCLEALILIGVQLKLGGAGITPHFRLHPEMFALPFLAQATVIIYCHFNQTKFHAIVFSLALLLFAAGMVYWTFLGFGEDAEALNNYFPSRAIPLNSQGAITVALLGCAGLMLKKGRSQWLQREMGEIK